VRWDFLLEQLCVLVLEVFLMLVILLLHNTALPALVPFALFGHPQGGLVFLETANFDS